MDVQKKRKRSLWRLMIIALLAASMLGASAYGLSLVKPSIPTINRELITLGEVKRGEFVRRVRGPGTLEPEDVTWVSAEVGGRVEKIFLDAGMEVKPDQVILQLVDIPTERAIRDAEDALESANAELERYRIVLEQAHLDLVSDTAQSKSTYEDQRSQAEMDLELAKRGLISRRQLELSLSRTDRNRMLYELQVQRVTNNVTTNRIQLERREASVRLAQENLDERKRRFEALTIRAPVAGILQQIGPSAIQELGVGQQVGSGTIMAKIADSTKLNAVLRIPETDTREVAVGQAVVIDTRNGLIDGRVARIDPAVQGGSVAVDVELISSLPAGARPDLSVEGTIEVSRSDDAIYVDRPVFALANQTISLFCLDENGDFAHRVQVELGFGSVNEIEVVQGLRPGQRIILSDMTSWDEVDQIAIR